MSDPKKGNTGAGSEAAQGIHSAKRDERSDVEHAHEEDEEQPGSEPLRHRDAEHKSGYGGEKGKPKTSSDQR